MYRGIVPPALLTELARRADGEERDALLRTLEADARLRAARARPAAERAAPAGVLATPGSPQRTISDCAGAEPTSDPKQVRAEGAAATGDPATDEAYDGLGATYSFYWEVFQRDSIDGRGLPLHGWVHYGKDYDNAFWDGSEMVFGDGKVFARFTKSLDVIGHELTHGVTEKEAGLTYEGQSGALNESISDCFGSMVKQHHLGQTSAAADWLIGADLVTPKFPGKALRSMKAPGTAWEQDDQPANMSGYVQTTDDNGGVHTNSGIPNKAFCDLALALGGHSWERAGRVWYETLLDDALKPSATFAQFAAITVAVAGRLFDATVAQAVSTAWTGVGVKPG